MRKIVSLLVLLIAYTLNVGAQCLIREVSLKDRCDESTVIVEGKVLEKSTFWNASHNYIYTRNVIEIYKVLKGTVIPATIEILTEGGRVDGDWLEVTNSLEIATNEYGIFMLKPINVNLPSGFSTGITRYQAVAATQGFLKFNFETSSASDVFHNYHNIQNELYTPIQNFSGQKIVNVKSDDPFVSQKTRGVTTISSFSPKTITAGTKSILTINGSGFGTTQGTSLVAWRHADYGGFALLAPLSTDYISWSDTQIKIYVTTKAGTGPVAVEINGNRTESVDTLKVTYARLNIQLVTGPVESNFIGPTNSGYKWTYNTQFSTNPNAKASFLRAFSTWRCATLVNWFVDTLNTTNINESLVDGKNVITFDIGATKLANGVLGQCSSLRSDCGANSWYIKELDIVFNSAETWNYSTNPPGGNEIDMESVALHELGHGQQLGHVIDRNDVMYFAIGAGEYRRTLNQYNLTCGNAVMTASVSTSICGNPKMVAIQANKCQISGGSPDITAPVITVLNPVNSATGVSVTSNLAVTFSEPIQAGAAGNLIIKSGATVFATIPVTSGQISIAGSTLTINPTSNLAANTNYFVTIDNGAIKDLAGNIFTGITSSTTWAFKTATSNGINEVTSNPISIFPNPSNGTFTVERSAGSSIATLEVYNLVGKIVYTQEGLDAFTTVKLSQPAGVYIIRVKNQEGIAERKLVVQ